MPESEEHIKLVRFLIDYITRHHAQEFGLCVYADTSDAGRGDKPRPVDGYVPDVFVVTVPSSFTIIGEAKTFGDLATSRSRSQLRTFLRFLQYSNSPQMILAVPLAARASAHGVLRALKREVGATGVCTEVITPVSRAVVG